MSKHETLLFIFLSATTAFQFERLTHHTTKKLSVRHSSPSWYDENEGIVEKKNEKDYFRRISLTRRRAFILGGGATIASLPFFALKKEDVDDGNSRIRGPGLLTDAIDENFARSMASPAAQIYEDRIAPRKKALFSHLDATCRNVLELGIGAGPNLKFYPPSVERLTGVDPNPYMLASIQDVPNGEEPSLKTTTSGVRPLLVRGEGEALPFSDSSFDAVVTTLVLCSVRDPEKVLSEISRVLKPGGKYLFMEHVRNEDPSKGMLGMAQDLFDPLQVFTAAGCHLNRRTGDAILAASGPSRDEFLSGAPMFESVTNFERFQAMGDAGEQFLISPHISGVAHKAPVEIRSA